MSRKLSNMNQVKCGHFADVKSLEKARGAGAPLKHPVSLANVQGACFCLFVFKYRVKLVRMEVCVYAVSFSHDSVAPEQAQTLDRI